MVAEPFALKFAPEIKGHLRCIDRKHHSLIQRKIIEMLTYEPDVTATNRKPLRDPVLGAQWEIRFGPNNRYRVFYDIDSQQREVSIVAIGEKERNQLYINGEEYP